MNQMNKLFIISLLLIMALPMTAQSGSDVADDQEDVYFILSGEADKAVAEGDYNTAVLRYREALDIDPANPANVMLWSNLGILYDRLDNDSLALRSFDEALSLAPSMTFALENRAKVLLKIGRNADAFRDFSSVLAIDSMNIESRYCRGLMSLYGGDTPGAERDFAVLEKIVPESTVTLDAMATLYAMSGREVQAIPYYRKLVEREPRIENFRGLARCCLVNENLTDASAVIEQGMNEFPGDAELHYLRAWLNRDRYMLKDAKADAEIAVRLGYPKKIVMKLFEKK